MSDEIDKSETTLSNERSEDLAFRDEIGKDVIRSAKEVQIQFNNLVDSLERQFDESSENILIESDQSPTRNYEKEQIDEIIDILNENDSHSSEEVFNNPSFDELDVLSKLKYGATNSSRKHYQTDSDDGDGSENHNHSMSSKIFELIDSMKSRIVEIDDEWDNDDDTGYITVTLSDQEFFEYEDVSHLGDHKVSSLTVLFRRGMLLYWWPRDGMGSRSLPIRREKMFWMFRMVHLKLRRLMNFLP